MNKFCRQCQKDVRRADFYRHPRTADRLQPICKSCHRANVKANRERNADYYREFDKARANLPHRVAAREAYAQTPEGLAAGNRAKRAYLERNPAKRAAHVMVGNAVRDGRLIRQPREVCGEAAQAHHDDYSKPLDVRWLCTTHHAEWHTHDAPPDRVHPDWAHHILTHHTWAKWRKENPGEAHKARQSLLATPTPPGPGHER